MFSNVRVVCGDVEVVSLPAKEAVQGELLRAKGDLEKKRKKMVRFNFYLRMGKPSYLCRVPVSKLWLVVEGVSVHWRLVLGVLRPQFQRHSVSRLGGNLVKEK